MRFARCLLLAICATTSLEVHAAAESGAPDSSDDVSQGAVLFSNHCAACHESGASRAPPKFALHLLARPTIYEALTTGKMRGHAAALSNREREQISTFLSPNSSSSLPSKMCGTGPDWFDRNSVPIGRGWGIDEENTRLIPAHEAGLSVDNVGSLQLKWAFSLPNVSSVEAQPLVVGSGVFMGAEDGTLYALDAASGCLHWKFKAKSGIKGSAVAKSRKGGIPTLFFADRFAYTYAVDARDGALVWRSKVDDHPSATIMGTPVVLDDRIFVPLISFEENAGGAQYPCCTFRGSLVALDASTGKTIWRSYTIPAPPAQQSVNALGVPQFAPSGAGLWSSPTVDRKRKLIYFTTGNNYSQPTDENSDAIFAVELKSGKLRWRTQTLKDDSWTGWAYGCRMHPDSAGCPKSSSVGPDLDFTTSPVLIRSQNGADILVASRKDGTTFGLSPDSGRIRWTTRTTSNPDPNAGAAYFGLMAEGRRVFIPSVGTGFPTATAFEPSDDDGLLALDAVTGQRLWMARSKADCKKKEPCMGLSFAPIGFPGVVFAGATDGYVRAYATTTGAVLWRFDTAQQFKAVNGETASGGAIGRNSIMIANGTVYVGSGFGRLPGNALLAFSPNKSSQTDQRRSQMKPKPSR